MATHWDPTPLLNIFYILSPSGMSYARCQSIKDNDEQCTLQAPTDEDATLRAAPHFLSQRGLDDIPSHAIAGLADCVLCHHHSNQAMHLSSRWKSTLLTEMGKAFCTLRNERDAPTNELANVTEELEETMEHIIEVNHVVEELQEELRVVQKELDETKKLLGERQRYLEALSKGGVERQQAELMAVREDLAKTKEMLKGEGAGVGRGEKGRAGSVVWTVRCYRSLGDVSEWVSLRCLSSTLSGLSQ
jgi:hypothetical protein